MTLAVKDATGTTQNIPFPNSNGQAPMAASAPVVIASDQIVAVSAAALPLPAGAAADGSDATGITPPAGGVGIRGWLSGIYAVLKSALSPTTSFVVGQAVSTLSAAALPAGALTNGLIITAMPNNTGTITIGLAAVSGTTGYPLTAGQSISAGVSNASAVYIIGTNTSDRVAYMGN